MARGVRFGVRVAALVAMSVTGASAQSLVCIDLQSQYLSLLRATDGTTSGRQMVDMDRISRELAAAQAAARQGNCSRLLFFGPRPSPQCPAIMAAIGRLQQQLAQMRGGRGFFFGRSPEFEKARLQDWLMQYGCEVPQLGGLRTICARRCDGYYFPISFSTSRQHMAKDAEVCQSMYAVSGQADLFAHTTNREVADAASLDGRRYGDQPYAFLYRQSFSPACSAELKEGIAALGERYWTARGPRTQIALGVALSMPLVMPMPKLRPGDRQEDPETIANRAGGLPVAPHAVPAETTATVASARAVRQVGDAYYAELFDPAKGAAESRGHRPPLGFDLIGSAMAMEAEAEATALGEQSLPQ